MGKNTLDEARKAKYDEFYTQFDDVNNEVFKYKEQFKGKTVFCNCDDPEYSNFWKYFQIKFYDFGLKKLISTHYENNGTSYKIEIVNTNQNDDSSEHLEYPDYIKKPLKGNGDFRSEECIELLKEADIVVTNPPFSLFREYVAQLIEYKKQFLIIGNQSALTYKEIFPLVRDNKMWLGYKSGSQSFEVPDSFDRDNTYIGENGKKYAKFGNICWFTNLDVTKRHELFIPYKSFKEDEYEKYDNYDAININRIVDIPKDYYGVMGVPVTFIAQYNPEQFKIIGLAAGNIKGLSGLESKTGKDGPYINGKLKFGRIFIQYLNVDGDKDENYSEKN